jgi:hypothetical protein
VITVTFLDPLTGTVEVLMDTTHRGLAAWDNHLCLEPYGTEDIIDGVVCARAGLLPRVPKWAKVVTACLLLSATAAVAHNYFIFGDTRGFDLTMLGIDRAAQIFTRALVVTMAVSSAIVLNA